MTVAEILEDQWFQIDYEPSIGIGHDEWINFDDVNAAFDNIGVRNSKNFQYYYHLMLEKKY